jgi:hypothetical protein
MFPSLHVLSLPTSSKLMLRAVGMGSASVAVASRSKAQRTHDVAACPLPSKAFNARISALGATPTTP